MRRGWVVAAAWLAWCWPALAAAAPRERLHLAPRTAGEQAIHTWRDDPIAAPSRLTGRLTTMPDHELQSIHKAGDSTVCLDLVFVADGFTALEKEAFWSAATAASEALLNFAPYSASQGLINTHALFVASAQSGADHPSVGRYVDTAFDTTFEYGGFQRLAVANNTKVLQIVDAALPDFDLAVVLVNDAQYGGSGGPVPVASLDTAALSILRHELAHNIAGLADEYTAPYPGYAPGDPEPNVAAAQHLQPPKWQAWVTPGTPIPTDPSAALGPQLPIGAYEGARYQETGMFRPAPQCLMRALDQPFCPVCAQAVTLGIAARTEMLRAREPASGCVSCTIGLCPVFAVATADVPTLAVTWRWNGARVGSGATFLPGPDVNGSGTLTAEVIDTTPLVRDDPNNLLVESVSWQINGGCTARCGAQCDGGSADSVGDAAAPFVPTILAPNHGCTASSAAAPPWAHVVVVAGLSVGVAAGRRKQEESA